MISSCKTLLSVVIPAYNVQHYIGPCLESALQQPRVGEVELIVVDDGSTDRTLEQIRLIQQSVRGRNIKVLCQENKGVSAARNAGIACATSPYIGFLDADDVWAAGFSGAIMPLLEAGEADIVEFTVAIVNTAGMLIDKVRLIDSDSVGPRAGDTAALLDFARTCQVFPAARVYRRSLWDGIEFPPGRVYEDCSAIPLVYTRAQNFHRLADQLYYYRRRAGSITQSATPHTVMSLALCAKEALERCDGGVNDGFWRAMFHKLFIYACLQAARVDTLAFRESMMIVEEAAASYRTFAGQQIDEFGRLRFHWKILAHRYVFQTKRLVKRILGRELRPPQP